MKPHPALSDALGHQAADKRLAVLARIDHTGSISQAARDVGVSYKAAWQAIDTLTNLAQVELVQRTVGGASGGGARLTDAGRELLAAADQLESARKAILARLQQGPGAPAATAGMLAVRTSMRNQLLGTITTIDAGDRAIGVRIQLSPTVDIEASITHESCELLGLQVGRSVIAMCKATAARVAPVGANGLRKKGWLAGRVSRVNRGPRNDEITLRLDGTDQQLVGFAPTGSSLATRSKALVRLDPAAIVVALPG